MREFVSAAGAELCVCLHYGLGYFRITGLFSAVAEAFDTLVFDWYPCARDLCMRIVYAHPVETDNIYG